MAIDLETTLIPERGGKKSSNLMAGKKQGVEVKSLIGDDQEKKLASTTNFAGRGLFYHFSSNGHPFEAQTVCSKFAAYTFP